MPDFRDSFTAREVCEGMLSQINASYKVVPFFCQGLGVQKYFLAKFRDSYMVNALERNQVCWDKIRVLMASCLLVVNNCPGLRTIGIGESLWHLFVKKVMFLAGADVNDVCGSHQLCTEAEAGIESVVFSVNSLFGEHPGSDWGVLLLGAANAFNARRRIICGDRDIVKFQHLQTLGNSCSVWV